MISNELSKKGNNASKTKDIPKHQIIIIVDK